MKLEAKKKAGPPEAARFASRFQVAWMNAARMTSASGSSDMRPPCPGATKKISTSPPLGFCPSGAAAYYRGFRNARTGGGVLPPGTLVATQSIDGRYSRDSRLGQPRILRRSGCQIVQQQRRAPDQYLAPARRDQRHTTGHSDEPERDQAFNDETVHPQRARCCTAQVFQCFPLVGGKLVFEIIVHGVQGLPEFPGTRFSGRA